MLILGGALILSTVDIVAPKIAGVVSDSLSTIQNITERSNDNKKEEKKGNQTVYALRNPETEIVEYVGRTNNCERRMNEHKKNPNRNYLISEPLQKNLTYEEARMYEQYYIELYGTLKKIIQLIIKEMVLDGIQHYIKNIKHYIVLKVKRMLEVKMKRNVWKKGDTFYYKIESEKTELNDRYLLFIKQDDKQWYNEGIPLFRVLITEHNQLPNTKEEIEILEHVQTGFKTWETRFLPGVGGISFDELIKERNKTRFYPDEYGYLNLYKTYIYSKKEKTKPSDWTYLGNFEINSKPEREFEPFDIYSLYSYIWEFQKKDLIECYWNYNLKNSIVYTHDRNLEIRKNAFKLVYPVVTFDIKDEAKREEIFKILTTIDENDKK